MWKRTPLLALLATALLSSPVAAGFWDRAAEGYWWYDDPIDVAPPETPPEPKPEAKEAEPQQKPVEKVAPKVEQGPTPFSPAWLREKILEYREAAVDNPSDENVRRYYYVQKIALDKATRFAEVAQRVVTGDPYLDENARRPSATFAARAMSEQAGIEEERALQKLAENVGILFFYRSDCPYCDAQADVLQMLQRRFGFTVLSISLDNAPLPGGKFPEFRFDPNLVRQLNVEIVPTLYLMQPKDQKMGAIAHGAVSLEDLRRRILLASVTAGWIGEGAFARTRPVNPTPLAVSVPAPNAGSLRHIETDPNAMVDYIRGHLKGTQ